MPIVDYLKPKNIARKARIHFARYRRKLLNPFVSPNPNPLFVLGNQKSGTTAIAALLAYATKHTVTLDIEDMEGYTNLALHQGQLTFEEFIQRNRYDFSKQIIKEPWLTFYFEELQKFFPKSRYIFIIRNPKDNIRSILNRLNIPGNLETIPEEQWQKIKTVWQLILKGEWMGIPGQNYIETLAYRWNRAVDVYLKNKHDMILIKYEDFLKDKENCIIELAHSLKLPVVQGITHLTEKQFQPAGDQTVPLKHFFGEKNLNRIEAICGERMKIFNYI